MSTDEPNPGLGAHVRQLLIAYAVAAVALLVIFALTQQAVVLAVLAVVAVVAAVHVLLVRRGTLADMVHEQARQESVARRGNNPPERPRGI